MDALKNIDLQYWWKLMAAAGALIAIASAPAAFTGGFLVGLGLLLFGIGEWSMVRKYERPFPATMHMPGGTQWVMVRERKPLGLVLDALGVIVFAFGLYRLL